MLHSILSSARTHTCPSFCRFNSSALSRNLSSKRHKIRMIILSDTHGDELKDVFFPKADVVLHCGDLTNNSWSTELERTLAMLRAIDAPLKLAIPGNHDFNLERDYWRRTKSRNHPNQQWQQQQQQQQQHEDDSGGPAQASEITDKGEHDTDTRASWKLLHRAAQRDRIFLLPQGTHTFLISSNADAISGDRVRLRLFASPLTPRRGNWGFQYDRSNPHKWTIPPLTSGEDGPVDVVMTHGPPRGIRDGTGMGQGAIRAGAGCAALLAAVERARPRVHCFGHIHGAWGAEVISWKREMAASGVGVGEGEREVALRWQSAPTFDNLVDARQSQVVASLPPANSPQGDACNLNVPPTPTRTTLHHRSPPTKEGDCYTVDISPDGEHPVNQSVQTLCVNAAVEPRSRPPRMPWVVDTDLPVAKEEDAIAAAKTMCRLLL